MKIKHKHIYFKVDFYRAKIAEYGCYHNKDDEQFGYVRWYPGWKQYCFKPYSDTVLSAGCLNDIVDFIQQLMDKIKKESS